MHCYSLAILNCLLLFFSLQLAQIDSLCRHAVKHKMVTIVRYVGFFV